ncbi:histone H1-delta-like [Penaeus chinensis]|uniref:histone H1-delta-like n=1 Tax=Penaeus chinensis TaxID=139456 RepID=UPI001FB6F38D|nr:histone H1-delta-like [Penaeus chinensis]
MVESAAKQAGEAAGRPKYSEMVAAAIKALKERSGSSRQAILKYVLSFYGVEDEKKAGVHVRLALKKGVAGGSLVQVKGTGASGSFKLAKVEGKAEGRKPAAEKPVAKKTTVKKPADKKTSVKKPAAQKTSAKETSAKKTSAKKISAKKTTAKKDVTKKPSVKKESQKKTTKEKVTTKKATAKKPPTKKTALKQPATKKVTKKSAAKKTEKKSTNKKRPHFISKRPSAKRAYPKYSEMVAAALRALNKRNGSSRQAILRFILASFQVGDDRAAGVHLKQAKCTAEERPPIRENRGIPVPRRPH